MKRFLFVDSKKDFFYGTFMPPYDEYDDEEFDEEEDDDFLAEDESITQACEDCDYRWRTGGNNEDEECDYGSGEMICPMCGSSNVVEI